MDDRWMRAFLRPLDLLAFLSMTPVPSDARTPHPGRVPPARLDIERCAACGYTLLVETRDDGTALEWELDETDYRNDNRKGKR